jgi:two-component system, NarL family, invasion response regulator UvrY
LIKILIVDDHPIFRQGLIRIISSSPDMVVVDEADNGQESLEKLKTIECNLVILDISMPGTNCFDLVKDIRTLKPKLPILIVTMHPEDQYALRLFKAGVNGYLTKEKAPTELIEAIRLVASGRMNVPPSVAEQAILGWRQESEKQSHENLSNREYQIMHMIVSGQKVSTIAKTLSISVKTVKTHRSRLLAKMNMSTNAELFHYAIKHNLVDDISV